MKGNKEERRGKGKAGRLLKTEIEGNLRAEKFWGVIEDREEKGFAAARNKRRAERESKASQGWRV